MLADPPLFEQTWRAVHPPTSGGRHRLEDYDTPTEEIAVGDPAEHAARRPV